jgi:hypothetical protein
MPSSVFLQGLFIDFRLSFCHFLADLMLEVAFAKFINYYYTSSKIKIFRNYILKKNILNFA